MSAMKINLKIKLFLIVLLLIMFGALYFSDLYKPQKPAKLSGFFLDVFNISKGEFHEIPYNITEAEIIVKGYTLVSLMDTDLEKYPTLKNAFKKNGKAIDLTDEEALLIRKDFDGKVIIEFNRNYYIVAIGKY